MCSRPIDPVYKDNFALHTMKGPMCTTPSVMFVPEIMYYYLCTMRILSVHNEAVLNHELVLNLGL